MEYINESTEYLTTIAQNAKVLSLLLNEFRVELDEILNDLTDLQFVVSAEDVRELALKNVMEDLFAFCKEDPSVKGFEDVAWETKGFKAVRYYRYLNSIYKIFMKSKNILPDIDNDVERLIIRQIRKYSELIKNDTGVEIHPMSNIGERFIIDHGTGTVIGERVTIGKNCELLNDVVLGTAFDPSVKEEDRHPTLGDNVKVYSGARILGNIEIGNNCIIGTKCIIKKSIPDNTIVSVVNQLQLTKNKNTKKVIIYGIIPQEEDIFIVYGKNLPCDKGFGVEFISEKFEPIRNVIICILENNDRYIKVKVLSNTSLNGLSIKIFDDQEEVIIRDCTALMGLGGQK